jgi:hypothetical protein
LTFQEEKNLWIGFRKGVWLAVPVFPFRLFALCCDMRDSLYLLKYFVILRRSVGAANNDVVTWYHFSRGCQFLKFCYRDEDSCKGCYQMAAPLMYDMKKLLDFTAFTCI